MLDGKMIMKLLKVAVYVGVSAAIASLMTSVEQNPELFLGLQGLINLALVYLKGLVDKRSGNA